MILQQFWEFGEKNKKKWNIEWNQHYETRKSKKKHQQQTAQNTEPQMLS